MLEKNDRKKPALWLPEKRRKPMVMKQLQGGKGIFAKNKYLFCLLTLCVFWFGLSTLCLAANTTFTPSADADDLSTALTLEVSSVADGATDVERDVIIELEFSKNVVNLAVQQNNLACFHLIGPSEEVVPIRVIFPDDQLQQDYKRVIFITPVEPLLANTEYELYIDHNLLAKNSTQIDNLHVISFTTGEGSGSSNATLTALGDNVVEFTSELGKTEFSVPVQNDLPGAGMVAASIWAEPQHWAAAVVGAAVVLLALVSGLLLWQRRQRQKAGGAR